MGSNSLPLSITELEIFKTNLDIRIYAREHWAVLRPLCDSPIRIEETSVLRRVVVLGHHAIERGNNYEYIRDEHVDGFDADAHVSISDIFCIIRDFDNRFEMTRKIAGWERSHFEGGLPEQVEAQRVAWDTALKLVTNELLELPVFDEMDRKILEALSLDMDAVDLARHFSGRALGEEICTACRHIELFRQFRNAHHTVRQMIIAALMEGVIDGRGDILGEIWAALRGSGISKNAIKKFKKLSPMNLEGVRQLIGRDRGNKPFSGITRCMKLLNDISGHLHGDVFPVVNWIMLGQNYDLEQPDTYKRFILPFIRMASMEAAKRRKNGDDETFWRELIQVNDWVMGLCAYRFDPQATAPAIDKHQEKIGWPWLMRKQEEWHTNILVDDFAWNNPELDPQKKLSWSSALPAFQDGGYLVEPLTNSMALLEEGRVMQHCVSTYASKCYTGKCRIFSVRDAASSTRLATGAKESVGQHQAALRSPQ